eukprot:TRINITY_DN51281_c0_g1_i1.p1 TRINITY_DN51281_c0_g1~~TRINITY_DN51281_c0_g1_i1.p1  ORF type:complete len:336 (+),score=46.91 TRINITY_DN51281_c0_g1_i1:176-1183(+)
MSVSRAVVAAVVSYTICSSMMLVANKAVISYLPLPGLVSCVQLAAAGFCVLALKCGACIRADDIELMRLKLFAPYAALFITGLFTNMKALQHASLETVVVFRSAAPLLVSLLEFLCLGRELPTGRSVIALVGVVCGTTGYVWQENKHQQVSPKGYMWIITYTATFASSIPLGKYLVNNVKLKEPTWGLVLYTNVISLPGMLVLAVSAGELARVRECQTSAASAVWLSASCLAGLAISWAGWNCQEKVSATVFALVGVGCKLLSIICGHLLLPAETRHASLFGLAWLSLSLISSTMYRQAPLRTTKSDVKEPSGRVLGRRDRYLEVSAESEGEDES